MNTIEADYQFSPSYSVHAGYRFTDRHIELAHLDRTTTLTTRSEEVDNQTHSAIFGLKARPVKAWTIYFDGEHGNADSGFTRLANNDFTNLRLRSRINASSQRARCLDSLLHAAGLASAVGGAGRGADPERAEFPARAFPEG